MIPVDRGRYIVHSWYFSSFSFPPVQAGRIGIHYTIVYGVHENIFFLSLGADCVVT